MKRQLYTLFCLLGLCYATLAQAPEIQAPDTLLREAFSDDPTPFMLPLPTGSDELWINYDADGEPTLCADGGSPVPPGWYWESDLGLPDPSTADNAAYTSCSFLNVDPELSSNRNWLITPPVFVPDAGYVLSWRSLSFQGPSYLDGYRVLVSEASNVPDSGDFGDTLFTAAQMTGFLTNGAPLALSAYTFSEGYIHANGFTDTSYYFLEVSGNDSLYRGRLEPHAVSLSAYSGKTIYIGFLHDSDDDVLLQLDDILVSNTVSSTQAPSSNILSFRALGNPVREGLYLDWQLKNAEALQLHIADQSGRLLLSRSFSAQPGHTWYADFRAFAPGAYTCTLQSSMGAASLRVVKL